MSKKKKTQTSEEIAEEVGERMFKIATFVIFLIGCWVVYHLVRGWIGV